MPFDRSRPSSAEVSQSASASRTSITKLRVAARAGRQCGRVRYDQLKLLGVGNATISRWIASAYLHPELPGVYAVGHAARSIESDLAAALLYAGHGAMLSHGTAVWWFGLLKYPPAQIHVSTPRRVRSIGSVVVHSERNIERTWHSGIPVTPPCRAILDFAATGQDNLLRLVLANADYHGLLDVGQLHRMMGQGRKGTAALREALAIHLPQLAHTRSDGEVDLLSFFQSQNIPIPEINVYLYGFLCDAVWHEQKLVVEVDGFDGHHTPSQLYANHHRDLTLRAKGFVVLRYATRQFVDTPTAVADDVLIHLAREL
jgi:predicted transcriptional regulator of viral defense system